MMDKVPGFTERQRHWFLGRDGGQCAFHVWDGKKWVRCKNTTDLITIDVHHLIARGWSLYHLGTTFSVNGPMNGISLCKMHHRGYRAEGDYRFVVHPDTEKARLAYATDQDSFKKMAENRRKLNEKGIPYWNTNCDWMFQRWVKKHTLAYLRSHPEDPFPDNKNRGRNGHLNNQGADKSLPPPKNNL